MTENEVRNLYVNTALSYLGVAEGSAKHKEIVSLYNGIKPLPVGYAINTSDDWCAAFVSAMAQKCKLTDIIFPECGCGRMISLYQKAGRWNESNTYTPMVGDIVFYDWDDNRRADHVGIVCEVSAGAMTVIEGNKGNKVAYRSIAVKSKLILGFGLPNYASVATSTKAKPAPIVTAPKSADIAVDGVWGQATTKKIQLVLGGLTVDGICGKLTVKALQKWAGMPEKEWDGIRGYKTNCAMQTKLNALGASPKLVVDGDFGKKSVTALQKWLNTK